MKLTHIFRIISRIFKNQWTLRAPLVVVVIISLGGLVIKTGPTGNQDDFSSQIAKRSKSRIGANSHLREAVMHSQNFFKNQKEEEMGKALAEVKTSLDIAPNNPYAERLLATLAGQERFEVDEQIKKTKEILAVRPDYAAAWLRLAILYRKAGQEDLALEALGAAQKLNLGGL